MINQEYWSSCIGLYKIMLVSIRIVCHGDSNECTRLYRDLTIIILVLSLNAFFYILSAVGLVKYFRQKNRHVVF